MAYAVQGSLEDTVLLERVMTGADCVISLLDPGGNTRDTALSDEVGIRRLIQIATASARDPQDRRDLRFGLMVTPIKRMAPGASAEIVRIAEAVRASRLDWTLVRVPLLNEKPQTKSVRVGYLGQGTVKTAISRADLAWFILEQVKKDDHVRKAPAISN